MSICAPSAVTERLEIVRTQRLDARSTLFRHSLSARTFGPFEVHIKGPPHTQQPFQFRHVVVQRFKPGDKINGGLTGVSGILP